MQMREGWKRVVSNLYLFENKLVVLLSSSHDYRSAEEVYGKVGSSKDGFELGDSFLLVSLKATLKSFSNHIIRHKLHFFLKSLRLRENHVVQN